MTSSYLARLWLCDLTGKPAVAETAAASAPRVANACRSAGRSMGIHYGRIGLLGLLSLTYFDHRTDSTCSVAPSLLPFITCCWKLLQIPSSSR